MRTNEQKMDAFMLFLSWVAIPLGAGLLWGGGAALLAFGLWIYIAVLFKRVG